MSNVRHPSTNVMTIQGTTCGSSAEKIFVGSTWYLGGHVIIGMRLLPRVQVLIVAHLPFFRPVGFVTPLATCFPDIIRNCSLLADWALSLHLLRSSGSTSVWRQLQALWEHAMQLSEYKCSTQICNQDAFETHILVELDMSLKGALPPYFLMDPSTCLQALPWSGRIWNSHIMKIWCLEYTINWIAYTQSTGSQCFL